MSAVANTLIKRDRTAHALVKKPSQLPEKRLGPLRQIQTLQRIRLAGR